MFPDDEFRPEQQPGAGSTVPTPDPVTSGEWHGSPYGNYTTPPEPPKAAKAKKHMGGKGIVALCLACALVGGGVSGGAVALVTSGRNQSAQTTSTVYQSDRTNVQTTQVAAGSQMSVSQIYSAYSGSVVSVEVSTANSSGAGTGFVIT